METIFCRHCMTLMTVEEYKVHYEQVVAPIVAEKWVRGGVFVTIDGDEYWAPSVQELQAEGIKVLVRHYRTAGRPKNNRQLMAERLFGFTPMEPKGGSTYVRLLAPDGYWSEGRSVCHKKDSFNKRAGYVLAVNRALSTLPGQFYAFDGNLKEKLADAVKESE